jgi:hypothetical protein
MIDENASSSSHYELIQAIIPLSSERIIDNKMEERNNEHFEPPEDLISLNLALVRGNTLHSCLFFFLFLVIFVYFYYYVFFVFILTRI